jgi:hypothetical protein
VTIGAPQRACVLAVVAPRVAGYSLRKVGQKKKLPGDLVVVAGEYGLVPPRQTDPSSVLSEDSQTLDILLSKSSHHGHVQCTLTRPRRWHGSVHASARSSSTLSRAMARETSFSSSEGFA